MPKQSDLNLYIEELHLQGARGNPEQIRAAVEQELARLFAESGNLSALQQGYNHSNLENSHLAIKPGATIDSIATQVAQHIYTGLSNPT